MCRLANTTILTTVLIGLSLPSMAAAAQLRDRIKEIQGEKQREGERDRNDERGRDEQRDPVRDRDRDRDENRVGPRLVLPGQDGESRWYLGVEVAYRDTGAQITSVVHNSPASRAGLEVRDIIVNVGGYQVGRVSERLYPLERELDLRADRRGHVSLLVQNHRNGQLTPLPVRLTTRNDRPDPIDARPLRGTVRLRRGVALPGNAVLNVKLLDVTDRRQTVVVRQRSYSKLGPLPLPFELVYTPSDIQPNHQYALTAEITVNGFAAYKSLDRYQVFQRDNQGAVDMMLVPARQ